MRIDKTQETYDKAFNKLKSGRGNLIGRVEKLKKLGAQTTKQIDQGLLDPDAEIESEENRLSGPDSEESNSADKDDTARH